MRKLLLGLSLLLLAQTAQADPLIHPKTEERPPSEINLINIKQFPNLKTGVFYAVNDSGINVITTTDIAKWKFLALEAGYAGDAENTGHKAVLTMSVDLLHVGDWIKFPILDKVVFRPGMTIGFGNINFKEMTDAEMAWGPSITAVEWKF